MRVALGEEKADLVLMSGDVVNVYSGEVLPDYSVAIKGDWIAYVGPDAAHTIGPETEIINASGKVLIPGLIDSHTHIINYCPLDEFLRYAVKGGTTTIITEIMQLTFASGYHGLVEYLDALKNQPIKVFATVPSSIALSESTRKRTPSFEQLKELLQRDEIVGVGEAPWQEILRGDQDFLRLSAESLKIRKTVEGHAAGARGRKLMAYLTCGVSSCHESTSLEEALEKLRLGVFVMIREGSVRKELTNISRLKDRKIDFRRLVLVTDGVDPRDLVEKGYTEFVVQKAIDLGFDPVVAIQMATINAAEHFNLDQLVGGIAPGRYADIVIIPNLKTIQAECVISNGRLIARQGELLVQPRKASLSLRGLQGFIQRVSSSDFVIRVEEKGPLKIRVIEQANELVTREVLLDLFPANGELKADPSQGLLKVSLVTGEGRIFTGFVRGFGMKTGALASSGAWRTFGVIVVGKDEEDMARAVNRVSDLGGGIVLYAEGQVQAELPLPIGGIISMLPIEAIVQRLEQIQQKAKSLGFPFADASLTLAVLTSPAIPFLRISEDGLVDVTRGKVLNLVID